MIPPQTAINVVKQNKKLKIYETKSKPHCNKQTLIITYKNNTTKETSITKSNNRCETILEGLK
ncbi:hypothetical protein [Terrisporobacter glycolicus]|uniref:hypothetical protein n=1 Tax=Terrisporobacter glycolicus TaxID=36841 RepID=UPI000401C38A|nr:hypothetical protein [Terrisporobacter glycolicus]